MVLTNGQPSSTLNAACRGLRCGMSNTRFRIGGMETLHTGLVRAAPEARAPHITYAALHAHRGMTAWTVLRPAKPRRNLHHDTCGCDSLVKLHASLTNRRLSMCGLVESNAAIERDCCTSQASVRTLSYEAERSPKPQVQRNPAYADAANEPANGALILSASRWRSMPFFSTCGDRSRPITFHLT